MSTVINTNIGATVSRTAIAATEKRMSQSHHRLSQGDRLNFAWDDAAGMAISGRMESQIKALGSHVKTAQSAQSLTMTADLAMGELTNILQRMRELALKASNGIRTGSDKNALDIEMEHMVQEVDAISKNTTFNSQYLLNGENTFTFYTDKDLAGESITLRTMTLTTAALSIESSDVNIDENANIAQIRDAISNIDEAITTINTDRANLGSVNNRMDHVIDNLSNTVFNTMNAESRIKDADFAVESTKLAQDAILHQAGTSMLKNSHQQKASVMQLVQSSLIQQ